MAELPPKVDFKQVSVQNMKKIDPNPPLDAEFYSLPGFSVRFEKRLIKNQFKQICGANL